MSKLYLEGSGWEKEKKFVGSTAVVEGGDPRKTKAVRTEKSERL